MTVLALARGGHDPQKIYAAARRQCRIAASTVILAKTVKGYGMGEAGEGEHTHQQKKMGDAAAGVRRSLRCQSPMSS